MYCGECGKKLKEGALFCGNCGHKIESIKEPIKVTKKASKNSSKLILLIVGGVSLLAIVGIVFLIIFFNSKKELEAQLLRDWSRVEYSDSTYYTLELDFTNSTIEYNFISTYSFLNTTIETYDYEVISGNKILVDGYREFTIELNDDKTMMTMTPAITNTDSLEFWYIH